MNHALRATRCAARRLAGTPSDRRAHLVGIAAAEMQALAELLVGEGWIVSGSDATEPPHWLWSAGIRTFRGYAADHLDSSTDLLIYSDAIEPDHIERRRAAELGIRQFSYPRMLGELMTGRVGLVVAGTRGAMTTTALAGSILSAAGLDPCVLGRGTPLGADSGGRRGRGRHFLAEGCENRGGFLQLSPHIAVILGSGGDDAEGDRSPIDVEASFRQLVGRLPAKGRLVVNGDCPIARRVADTAVCRVVTFGLEPRSDWRAQWLHGESGRYRFEIAVGGEVLGEFALRVPGRHNVLNALAAVCLAAQVGADSEAIRNGIHRFSGLRRRLERIGFWQGALWLDDDAHHPADIGTTLSNLREMFPNRRIWCIFQPHRAPRTGRSLDELAASLAQTDCLAVADGIDASDHRLDEGSTDAADIAERVRARGTEVWCEHRPEKIFEAVASAVRGGEILLTLGASEIRNVWHVFTERLRSYRAAG